MSVLGWIVLGLIAGFIGGKIVNHSRQGFLLDIVLGIVGRSLAAFSLLLSVPQELRASISIVCSLPSWARSSCCGAIMQLPAVRIGGK
jgi:uncharacterized membrane protein YeaQ/YmgE (transglycosylase-associated protein family)